MGGLHWARYVAQRGNVDLSPSGSVAARFSLPRPPRRPRSASNHPPPQSHRQPDCRQPAPGSGSSNRAFHIDEHQGDRCSRSAVAKCPVTRSPAGLSRRHRLNAMPVRWEVVIQWRSRRRRQSPPRSRPIWRTRHAFASGLAGSTGLTGNCFDGDVLSRHLRGSRLYGRHSPNRSILVRFRGGQTWRARFMAGGSNGLMDTRLTTRGTSGGPRARTEIYSSQLICGLFGNLRI